MNVTLANIGEYMPVIADLMRENWEETGDRFEFDPDLAVYLRLEQAGILFAFAAIHNGQVIGYCTAIVSCEMHNPAIITCTSDALFVKKEYRNTTAGGRLMLAVEQEAMKRGAMHMRWVVRTSTPMRAMLEKHGYSAQDVTLTKEF